MAALLIALSVMAILWTMAVPKWQTLVRREKEAELIFRAGQYAHAIALYQRRYANAFPRHRYPGSAEIPPQEV